MTFILDAMDAVDTMDAVDAMDTMDTVDTMDAMAVSKVSAQRVSIIVSFQTLCKNFKTDFKFLFCFNCTFLPVC
jgi:hypothetical protein